MCLILCPEEIPYLQAIKYAHLEVITILLMTGYMSLLMSNGYIFLFSKSSFQAFDYIFSKTRHSREKLLLLDMFDKKYYLGQHFLLITLLWV